MEKIIQITALTQANNAYLIALTNQGRIWNYTPTTPPSGHGTWALMDMPPGMSEQPMFEEISAAGRVNTGYQIWKDKEHGMFCFKHDGVQSEFYERLEGAIGAARMDYQIKHPQKPPPPKPPPEVVP